MAIKKVGVYGRKSRDAADKTTTSIEGQINVLIELCDRRGYEYEIFHETGSSEDWNRPEFQKMLAKIKYCEYDAIVVFEQSRISRDIRHFADFKEIMLEAGCLLITPNSTLDFNNEDDEFRGDIDALIMNRELKNIKKRLIRGTRENAKKGHWMGKKCPFGYHYNRAVKSLEIVPDEASIIKRMFNEYIGGKSSNDIAYEFSRDFPDTLEWSDASIARMLGNIAYAGHSLYGRTKQSKIKGTKKRKTTAVPEEEQILIRDTHDAIIDPSIFERVQQIKKERNSRPPALKIGRHKFSGLIKCGKCGAIHSFQMAHGRKRITSCQTRTYHEDGTYTSCSNGGAYVQDFEALFHTYFAQYVDQLEQYVHLLSNDETQNFDEEIKRKEKQVEKIQKDVKRVQQAFLAEIFTQEEAREQIASLKGQATALEEQIEALRTEGSVSEHDKLRARLENMKRFLIHGDNMQESEANEILRDYIDTIIYTKKGNEIILEIVVKD